MRSQIMALLVAAWCGATCCGTPCARAAELGGVPKPSGGTVPAADEQELGIEPMPSEALRGDAQLADVTFVDEKIGWAVGDRGAIWHTDNGGRTWSLQNSQVGCRLTSVTFLNDKTGWAAGGYTQPYTHVSRGVVLRTRDGGEHWSIERKVILPAVERIGFFDVQRGWALGQASALFPSGVFTTDDGGRSWSALPADVARGWLAGDFIDAGAGALAGRSGRLAVIRQRAAQNVPTTFGLRAIARMHLPSRDSGWLVGDGGLVLASADRGQTWQPPHGALPDGAADLFDFAAVAVRGAKVWIAGAPGTRVFSSLDGGHTWHAADTGQSLPIRGLAFANDQIGWAVGDLGAILCTADGGRTWQPQRAGGARLALMGFYGRASELPLELFAKLADDEGYLAAACVLGRDDLDPTAETALDPARQVHEAAVRSGASAGLASWRFPLRQAGLRLSAAQIVADWDRINDAQAIQRLEAEIVTRIRTWRPSVVLTTAPLAQDGDALTHVVNQIVLRAIEAAGNPAKYPELARTAGLPPWSVQKVFAGLAPGETGTVTLNTDLFTARYGRSVGELAAPARGVLTRRPAAAPASLGFRLLVDQLPQETGRRDFLSGITIAPGGDARRRYEAVADSDLATLHRQAQRRRNVQAVLAKADTDAGRSGAFLAELGEQTRTFDPDRAAELWGQLAAKYRDAGRWALAAECCELIVERYPHHPLAAASLEWLVQYYASGEAAARQQASGAVVAVRAATAVADLGAESGAIRRAGGAVSPPPDASAERLAKADAAAKQLELLHPTVLAEPQVRFALAAAHRASQQPKLAERYYLSVRHGRPRDAWWTCAQGELWLAGPRGKSPKETWSCVRTSEKPRLDGKLDEALWSAANTVELHSAARDDAEWPAVAMLACDDEFLYLGISCTHAPGFDYQTSEQPRPRDAELDDRDRVELLIDVDRDFTSYYRLVIDHRGWTHESCWGDASWDPDWYVAHGDADGVWTAEAAIPLAELGGKPPVAGATWAVGIQRVAPGAGLQSWTTPAAVDGLPEGFGYLMFRNAAK